MRSVASAAARAAVAAAGARIRYLESGEEKPIDHGPGRLWRAAAAGEAWVAVWVAPAGQTVHLPTTTLAERHCRGPVASYSVFGVRATHVVELVPLAGGPAVPVEGVIGHVGSSLLRRREGGELVWEGGGPVMPVAPASCDGFVLDFQRTRGPVLLACRGEGKPSPVYWSANGTRRPLGWRVDTGSHGDPWPSDVWFDWSRGDTDIVRLQDGQARTFGVETEPFVTYGDKSYLPSG